MLYQVNHPEYVQQTCLTKDLFSNQQVFQDKVHFLLFLVTVIIFGAIAAFAFTEGDPGRYIYGADSWGNVCGRQRNTPITNALLPGLDHSGRKLSFYFITNDVRIPFNPEIVRSERYASICVSECERAITPCNEMLERQGYMIEPDLIDRRLCTMLEDLIIPQQLYYDSCVPAEISQVNLLM